METDGSDNTQARYTLAPFGYGDLVSQRRGDDSRFFHFDAIGTTRALTEADQAVTDSYIHRAFGTYVSTTGDTLNYFRYLGKLGYYQDWAVPDGGRYVRRRYYAAGLGRFLSRDPGHQVLRPYGYANGSPLMLTDPSGEQPQGALQCEAVCGWAKAVSLVWYGMCMYACMTGKGRFAPPPQAAPPPPPKNCQSWRQRPIRPGDEEELRLECYACCDEACASWPQWTDQCNDWCPNSDGQSGPDVFCHAAPHPPPPAPPPLTLAPAPPTTATPTP